MKISLSFNQIGYLYYVDKSDYDYVTIISKEKLEHRKIVEIIKNNFSNYSTSIFVTEYELFDGSDCPFENDIPIEIEYFPVINLTEYEIKKPLLKKSEVFDIDMPITDANKLEILEKEFQNASENLFQYNGAITLVDKQNLKKIKSIINEIEEKFKNNIS